MTEPPGDGAGSGQGRVRGGRRLTACRAMVADDREKVIGGDLGRALLGEEGAQVKALEGEGHVAADLERVHDLVPKALQVNAQDLRLRGRGASHSWAGQGPMTLGT